MLNIKVTERFSEVTSAHLYLGAIEPASATFILNIFLIKKLRNAMQLLLVCLLYFRKIDIFSVVVILLHYKPF